MLKLKGEEVQVGMEFVLNKYDKLLAFPLTGNNTPNELDVLKNPVKMNIGDKVKVLKQPHKQQGINFIYWQHLSTGKPYYSHWITFKHCMK